MCYGTEQKFKQRGGPTVHGKWKLDGKIIWRPTEMTRLGAHAMYYGSALLLKLLPGTVVQAIVSGMYLLDHLTPRGTDVLFFMFGSVPTSRRRTETC